MSGREQMKPGAASSTKYNYDDLVNFPDDGKRHEIIDGEHYVTPSPNTKHQTVSSNLHGMLWTYLRQRPIGRIFAAPFDVVLSNLDVVEPDLLYVSRERFHVLTGQHVRGVPDLVVEILSAGTRKTDGVTKRKLYDRSGVQEYWIVDPELDVMTVYRRANDVLMCVSELSAERSDLLTSPLLPDFSLPLREVFV